MERVRHRQRQRFGEGGEEIGRERGGEEKDRGARQREACAQRGRGERKREAGRRRAGRACQTRGVRSWRASVGVPTGLALVRSDLGARVLPRSASVRGAVLRLLGKTGREVRASVGQRSAARTRSSTRSRSRGGPSARLGGAGCSDPRREQCGERDRKCRWHENEAESGVDGDRGVGADGAGGLEPEDG